MKEQEVIELIKASFDVEISNVVKRKRKMMNVFLESGRKVKICVKKVV